ncbi:uncharacterized protein LOC128207454 [Mya arenaria]|uniref:uncharacterized protein LOC128207454 n=1 Tax=Mya arenaria TaxID=6604 RepID=UPI0022E8BBDC|nr:uncharacterized protein LOC128207454 [Mya arenaria]
MKIKYGWAYFLSVSLVASALAQPTDKIESGTTDGGIIAPATGGIWNFLYGQGMSPDQQRNIGLIEEFVTFSDDYTTEQSMTQSSSSDNSATEASATQQYPDAINKNTNEISPDTMPPEEFAKWLNSIEPGRTQKPTETETSVNIDHANPEEFPPDKFRNWLESKTPRPVSAIETHHRTKAVDKQTGLSRNMIIVISTAGGTACFCIILIASVFCLKRKKVTKTVEDVDYKNFTVKTLHPLSVTGKTSDLFMGIPANNEIWKDLQTLPKSSSNTSLSDSEKK